VYSDGARGPLPDVLAAHEGAFKTPTLRCLARQPSFMHTGQMRTLDDVVAFFARGGDGAGFPGTNELTARGLTVAEQADIVAFIAALEGAGPAPSLLAAP
jgi:cytochrome c peroxidase